MFAPCCGKTGACPAWRSAEILDHEVNKFSQCDNTHAREVYGWQPQVDIETGLGRVIEAETRMLEGLEK